MRNVIARALSLVVAIGVVTLLVAHAGIAGCAPQPLRPDPWLATPVPLTPVPTAPPTIPVVSVAGPAAPVPPDPVIDVGPGGYLPASKAAPVLWANPAPSSPAQQQAAPSPPANP